MAALCAIATVSSAQRQFEDLGGLSAIASSTPAVALGDIDGDGDLDLLCAAKHAQNRLYENDGTGAFHDATRTRLPVDRNGTQAVAFGDIDRDGDLDIVCGNAGFLDVGGQNRLYVNNGAGLFVDATERRLPALLDKTWAVSFADVDGDRDLDLVFGNTGRNRLYLNDGAGNYRDVSAVRLPADRYATTAVALTDVDGDGDLDLACGNASFAYPAQPNRLYVNDGKGAFSLARLSLPAHANHTTALVFGDVDGDGDPDMVVGNANSAPNFFCWDPLPAANRLYLNDGRGVFTDASSRLPAAAHATQDLALGDIDEDGDLDIVTAENGQQGPSRRGGQNQLLLNDGRGAFTAVTALRLPSRTEDSGAVALGDVDGDGDLDAVIGNGTCLLIGGVRLELNLLRQLHAPVEPKIGGSYQLEIFARFSPSRSVVVALPFVSTGSATIPLPPLGTLRLDPTRIVGLPSLVLAQPAGKAVATIKIPNNPRLLSVRLFGQAVVVTWPRAARLTGVTAAVIGV